MQYIKMVYRGDSDTTDLLSLMNFTSPTMFDYIQFINLELYPITIILNGEIIILPQSSWIGYKNLNANTIELSSSESKIGICYKKTIE